MFTQSDSHVSSSSSSHPLSPLSNAGVNSVSHSASTGSISGSIAGSMKSTKDCKHCFLVSNSSDPSLAHVFWAGSEKLLHLWLKTLKERILVIPPELFYSVNLQKLPAHAEHT